MKYPELSHHYKMHRRDAPAPVSLTAVLMNFRRLHLKIQSTGRETKPLRLHFK